MRTIPPVGNELFGYYQPGSKEDCEKLTCRECIFSNYRPPGDNCPFRQWIIDHPVEKPTDTTDNSTGSKLLRKVECIPRLPPGIRGPVKIYQRYRVEQVIVKTDDIQDSNITIPDNAIMMKHTIITPGIFNFERDLVHVITWLEPIE